MTEYTDKFIKGLRDNAGLDISDLSEFDFVGGSRNTDTWFKYFEQCCPGQQQPPYTNECVCGQNSLIKNYYLKHRTTDKIIIIGSECYTKFTDKGMHRECLSCGDIHRNTSDNLCNKCRIFNEEPLKKDKKILDYCIENNIINDKQIRVWNTFRCFASNNVIQLYNYEQLSEILDIKINYIKSNFANNTDIVNNYEGKCDMMNILCNLNYVFPSRILYEFLEEKFQKIYDLNKLKNCRFKLFEEKYNDERLFTLIPDIYDSNCFQFQYCSFNRGCINYIYNKKDNIFTCKKCNNEYYIRGCYNSEWRSNLNWLKDNNICLDCKKKTGGWRNQLQKFIVKVVIHKPLKIKLKCDKCDKKFKINILEKFPVPYYEIICNNCNN